MLTVVPTSQHTLTVVPTRSSTDDPERSESLCLALGAAGLTGTPDGRGGALLRATGASLRCLAPRTTWSAKLRSWILTCNGAEQSDGRNREMVGTWR